MIRELVQTGQARYEFKVLSYIGPQSDRVGLGMICALQQSGAAFWEFYDRFLVDRSSAHRREQLISFATDIGLDSDQFTQCYNDPATRRQLNDELNAARALGISHGPRTRVDDQSGGTTFTSIQRAVERAIP